MHNTMVIYWHTLILEKEGTIVVNYYGIFITLAHGANGIILFSAKLTNGPNKPECLSWTSLYSLV